MAETAKNLAVADEPQGQLVSFISALEKAASNPDVDVDKMKALLDMQERIIAKRAEAAFNQAMAAAQAEMGPVSADATNPQTRSRYATYHKLDKALRPIYTKHGFAISFDESESPKPDHIRVLAYVMHRDGHTRTYHKDLPADGKGAKGGDVMTKTHAAGAAQSYGMRYLLKGIFNVAIGEDDDDGNSGPRAVPTISESQLADLKAKLDELPPKARREAEQGGLKWAGIERWEDLPAAKFAAVIKGIEARQK